MECFQKPAVTEGIALYLFYAHHTFSNIAEPLCGQNDRSMARNDHSVGHLSFCVTKVYILA